MEADGPAKRLFVYDIDEDERKSQSESESREIREQAQETGLDENLLAHLPGRRAEKAQQSDFTAAVNDQSKQCTSNAHHRNNHRDGLQRVRYGESAVENADSLGAQIAI